MNPNVPGFQSMTPEDRIRALRSMGVNDHGARTASDVQDFVSMAGEPGPGQRQAYGMQLANFLAKRGHNVNLNM